MSIRFLLWDNDGVLVDTEHAYFDATQRALYECGIALDRAQYTQIRARGESAWQLAVDLPAETIARHRAARDAYYEEFLANNSLEIPGAHDVLGQVSARYRMAIVTTSTRRHFDLIHRGGRLVRHMQFELTQEDYPRAKPAPDGYLAALTRFGADPGEAIVIEDSAQGLNAALAAGIRCVVVHNDFFGDVHDFDGAAARVSSIRDVPDAIDQLVSRAVATDNG